MRTKRASIRLLCTAIVSFAAGSASAQGWQPARAVRWVVPYVPGGATDLVTRSVADPVTQALEHS